MADIELVVKIPEEHYEMIQNSPNYISADATQLIRDGIPLPKGHGRLIDADEVLKAMNTWDKFGYTETGCFIREPKNDYVPYVHYEDMVSSVNSTTTIIEADKENKKDEHMTADEFAELFTESEDNK